VNDDSPVLEESTTLQDETEQPTSLKVKVLGLAGKLSDLVHGEHGLVEDSELSHEVALSVKSYVDRLHCLQLLLHPIESVIRKRGEITELRTSILAEVAEIEDVSDSASDLVAPALLNELKSELSAVKKDRKLFVSDEDEEDEEDEDGEIEEIEEEGESKDRRQKSLPLLELPIAERLLRILGSIFVGPQRLEEIFGHPLAAQDRAASEKLLESLWVSLFDRPQFRPHVEANHLAALRKAFKDYALLFRCSMIPGAPQEEPAPCSIKHIRERLPACFGKGSARSLWYAKLPFYTTPISAPHWALVDRQYLNCTFKKPSIRLLMYARANDLAPKAIRQKSVVEDVYDRAVLEAALKSPFFDNCNSLTRTKYVAGKQKSGKQVFVYSKDDALRITGKRGTPHWRPGRALWPGVLVSVVFEAKLTS